MKQHPKRENCIAVVAAMATNTKLEELEKSIGAKNCYGDKEIFMYLLKHNYYIGAGFEVKSNNPIKKNSILKAQTKPQDGPALVVVISERSKKEGLHAIYWDGTQVFDPNPFTEDGRPLNSYKIVQWFPIRKLYRKSGVDISSFKCKP